MSADASVSHRPDDATLPVRLDPACDRFEAAWLGGHRPRLEDFLPLVAEADRSALLRELLALEREYRVRRGERPTAEEYHERLPEYAPVIDEAFSATLTWRGGASAPSAPAPPGYEVLGELGRGGMGVVYKARQVGFKRVVALKMILSGAHAGPEQRERFRIEAEAVARLPHPNIVQVYEVGEYDGKPYFSMEFCPGGSLARKLNGTPLSPREAAGLVETLARGVQAAHAKGVVHRDLKPANVLLAEDGAPKVSDFGLAKRMDAQGQTQSGAVMGTPSYMAPEQAAGRVREIGPAADVYALGVILYECLTGRPPFRGPTDLETLGQVLSDEPAPPRQLQPKTPRDLETICLKCLQKEPRRRYATADALAEDLRRFRAGEPITARPVRAWERAAKWVRRRPAVAASLALFVVALLAGTGVSSYFAVTATNALSIVTAREKQLNEANAQVNETNQRLEETVARGLLRPLGHQADVALTDPEVDALWELAGSPVRVRTLFIEEALRRPHTAAQLRNRADLAVHSAVGLDPALRRQAEAALLARLRDEPGDFHFRTSCTRISVALDDWSPGFATAAARLAVDVLARKSDPDVVRAQAKAREELAHAGIGSPSDSEELCDWAEALAALAPRLGPAEAADAARQDLDALVQIPDSTGRLALSEALAALAPRLEPAEAAADASRTVDALAGTSERYVQRVLTEALAALAARLGPAEASAAAHRAVDAMVEGNDPSLPALLGALGVLGPRMEPGEAARLRSAAARPTSDAVRRALDRISQVNNDPAQGDLEAVTALAPRLERAEAANATRRILEVMKKTTTHSDIQPALSAALAALAPRLGAAEASDAARQILDAMGGTNDPSDLNQLASVAAALAPRLGAAEASDSARRVLDEMASSVAPHTLIYLGVALASLSRRLEQAEAARLSSAAGRRLADDMAKTKDPVAHTYLAWAWAEVAPSLGPAEASDSARRVLDAIAQSNDDFARRDLAAVVAALAPQLGPAETSDAARQILQAMEKTTSPEAQVALSAALAALVPGLEPGEAAAAAHQAVAPILQAMAKTADPYTACNLSGTLAALAPRLGADEASDAARQAAQRLLDAFGKATNFSDPLPAMASAMSALAPLMRSEDSAVAAGRILDVMVRTNDPADASALADALAALTVRSSPGETSGRIGLLAWVVGDGALPTLFAAPGPLAEASRPLPGRFAEQELVDLLKFPTCRKEARQVIVRQLGRQCGRPFANQWEFVEWARDNRPDLDLTSPPVRPDSP